MKSYIFVALLATSTNAKRLNHNLVGLGDWEDLAVPGVMGINGVQNYINTKETYGYRLARPTINTSLFSQAGDISNALNLKNDERKKAVAGL